MKRASLSYDAMMATSTGSARCSTSAASVRRNPRTGSFDLLYPLLDLTTTLDPLFTVGYRFGAIFLAEPKPGGAGRPDQAIALLEKGIAFDPAKWDYYQDIGFIYYWHLHDYEHAAEWFGRGGEVDGRALVAAHVRRGHADARRRRQASRAMWVQIGQNERRVAAPERTDFGWHSSTRSTTSTRCGRSWPSSRSERAGARVVGGRGRRRSDSGRAARPGRHTVRSTPKPVKSGSGAIHRCGRCRQSRRPRPS